ncbi:MAG: hypothetical protein HC814_06660 [Rhodobacteraceae bacterium]|nr:hypothetical protein [Paracoccaceae bacterium]
MSLRSIASAFGLAATLGFAAVVPAQASSFVFDLPTLAWPTAPAPVATQGCFDPATLTDPVCPAPKG